MHFQDNQPEVHRSVDGIAGLFTIDTGDASSLLLIGPFARRYGLVTLYRADLPYDGKAITATNGVFARRRVGTVAFDGPDGRPVAEAHDPITRISLQHAGFDANREVFIKHRARHPRAVQRHLRLPPAADHPRAEPPPRPARRV